MKTFADSTRTPGEFIGDRCYILAQLPEESNLDWARDLRTKLGGNELKFGKYLEQRHLVQADTNLWKRVLNGTAEATVVVIENRFYIDAIAFKLRNEGADLKHDVTLPELLKEAALCMINHAPVMRIPELASDQLLPTAPYQAAGVYKRIGEKFSDAMIFAARAHAVFDVDGVDQAGTTNEMFMSPHREQLVSEIQKVNRIFDNEHPKSTAVLNEMFSSYQTGSDSTPPDRFWELDSHDHDVLQAADFCAGIAAEIMMNATDDRERELRRHFRRVIVNGRTR